MGFEFKHIAYLTVLGCSLWALIVTGLTSMDELGKIQFASELPQEERTSVIGEIPLETRFNALVKVMNLGLPLALLAIVMLLLTYSTNPIGFGSMGFAILVFLFASMKTMETVDIINATSEFSLGLRVWWWI